MTVQVRSLIKLEDGTVPFNDAVLVVGKSWGYSSDMGQNIDHFMATPVSTVLPKTVIKKLRTMKAKGVVFGGLEWASQIDDLVQLFKSVSDEGFEVMIMTGNQIEVFERMVGQHAINYSEKFEGVQEMMDEAGDEDIPRQLGQLVLDYFAGRTYYIMSECFTNPKFHKITVGDEHELSTN